MPCEWITKASLEFETGLSVEFESAKTRSFRDLSPSIEVALCASAAATPFLIRSKRVRKAGGVSPSLHEALATVKLRGRRFSSDPGPHMPDPEAGRHFDIQSARDPNPGGTVMPKRVGAFPGHTAAEVGQFSEDGLWWWDGTTWIATAQIVLPQLPLTEFEQSGKLEGARSFMRRASPFLRWNTFISVGLIFLVPWLAALRDYRSWKLEQLALATAYLLGPHETVLAGETSLLDSQTTTPVTRDLAVAVTAAHILVFDIDSLDGQPRLVAFAGRATDVKIELRSFLFGLYPALWISGAKGQWRIRGTPSVFRPEPVLEAWRQAAKPTLNAG